MNSIIKRTWNQNRLVNIEDLTGMVFQAEADGHTFEISGVDDEGNAVALSGSVAGVFRRPDNADIALTGSASDGVVSVTLSEDCHAVPGRFGLTIFVTSNSQKVAVYACVGTVAVSSTGNVAGDTPANVEDLIDDINAAIADLNTAIGSIPADYSQFMAAIAPAYSSSALYAVGSYAWHDGTLYRCNTPITTAETWTAAHWTAAVLGDDVGDLKRAFDNNFDTVIGKNLIDLSACVTGAVQSNGNIATNGSWANHTTSPLIALDANTDYSFCECNHIDKQPNVNSRKVILLYTDESTPDASTYVSQTGVTNLSFNSGSTYKYARAAWQTSYLPLLESGTLTPTTYQEYTEKEVLTTFLGDNAVGQVRDISGNILYGKKWAVCGDSFTNGATSTKIPVGKYAGERFVYPYLIGNRNNMNIVKFFEGGRTLAWPINPGSFVNSITNPNADWYYQNIPDDVDYITFYLGINDQSHSAQGSPDGETTEGLITLGTIDDTGANTYYGAWNNVLTWLVENRPNAKIGIIVTNGLAAGTYQGASGADWVAAQKAIARKYGIPFIDMNGDDRTPAMLRALNPTIASTVKHILIDKWAVDPTGESGSVNTHPNDDAHEYESMFIEAFLRSL